MSSWAHPDKFRFFADFTGADGRRNPNYKPPEVVGEGLIAESEDGTRVCGFWPVSAETIETVKADVARIANIRNGDEND